MDDYAREMMELKTLVTRTLEKKGVLAKIRAELRASVFEAIEDEDRVAEENEDGGNPALLGSCNDRAKQLHASPSGRLLTALIGEYLEWAQLSHTMKVYLPECNLPKDFWKNELKDFSNKNGPEGSRSAESGPMLLDVLEGYLKYENLSQTRMAGRRMVNSESDPTLNNDNRNMRRPPSSSSVGGMPPMGRQMPSSQTSDRRGGSSASNTRKEEYNWGYDDDISEEVLRTTSAMENVQLDRKTRNLTTSWRHPGNGAE
ncbi:protein TONNEAU 1b-like [Lolium rigidum]|uniref:protein TONNEAU 1b-like n=1 Tax=Lolium rigidum TaxID=89674 RepID=UPI001F5E20B0|nr:protein TONNEAU 1b-like [Lolium rigidum]XP_047048050.1 protein TONNEAU 1b-like [Lolium rigidum]XP_051186252.1 protein TONNEAU 1b-like isoform X1 [Lolium perenne]